ncbi:hypothetical protein [Thermus amyloliquefaciens]|uniref:hypothetical protein n=1 Tax=Thermus amyloliquefaciens TaxID=1449080 RepID=UPI00056E1D0C|nr:hypothetical protein [Thermus amyloliquefaciens]
MLGAAWAGGAIPYQGTPAWVDGEGREVEVDPLEEGGALILREFCGHALRHATRLGLTPEEAAWRWVEYAKATRGRKALTTSRALTLLLREALAEVEAEEEARPPVEVVKLARAAYVWLLRSGRLAYWIHVAESLGSLVLACELLGLVEGVEWDVVPRAPPGEEEVAACV